jgi:hypothetical protein
MALNKEDKADVKQHMGKALANKVSKVTKDKNYPASTMKRGLKKIGYEEGHRRTNYDGAGVYTGKHGSIGKAGDSYSMKMKNTGISSQDKKYSKGFSVPAGVNYKAHGKGLSGAKN